MTNKKTPEIVFAPGAFDEFEGTQEELNKFMAEIKSMFADGSFLEKSTPVDLEELRDSDPELYIKLTTELDNINIDKRKLQ
jgi:hypothetical protein